MSESSLSGAISRCLATVGYYYKFTETALFSGSRHEGRQKRTLSAAKVFLHVLLQTLQYNSSAVMTWPPSPAQRGMKCSRRMRNAVIVVGEHLARCLFVRNAWMGLRYRYSQTLKMTFPIIHPAYQSMLALFLRRKLGILWFSM